MCARCEFRVLVYIGDATEPEFLTERLDFVVASEVVAFLVTIGTQHRIVSDSRALRQMWDATAPLTFGYLVPTRTRSHATHVVVSARKWVVPPASPAPPVVPPPAHIRPLSLWARIVAAARWLMGVQHG